MTTCHIVVLEYNGYDLLRDCLPSIMEAAVRASEIYGVALTVLNNGTPETDESRRWFRELADQHQARSEDRARFQWEDAPQNRVLCSYNAFAQAHGEDVMIFLNNDIRVEPDFVAPLMRVFEEDENAFFAAPKVISAQNGLYEGGRAKLEFRRGLPWGSCAYPGHEVTIDQPGRTMQTGFGAFRRDRFLELGGYDPLYLPGTVEDMDLCFRGYRQGWTGHYCPDSRVQHIGQATFKKEFGALKIQKMNRRNLHLFVLKNIHDQGLLHEYRLWKPIRRVVDALRGRGYFNEATTEAEARWSARENRQESRTPPCLTERDVFKISEQL